MEAKILHCKQDSVEGKNILLKTVNKMSTVQLISHKLKKKGQGIMQKYVFYFIDCDMV